MVLSDLDPEVLRVLTQRKVVDYLRRRRGPALARGDYSIEVIEGRRAELVTPEEPDGVRLDIPRQSTLWGRIEFELYVAARPDRRRRVAVVGRAGTSIIDDITELEEFCDQPWSSDQVSGLIAFEALQQTAGRRAILRDREAFPIFVDAVRSVEPLIARTLERVAKEVDAQTADRLADTVRRIFGKVLKELSDLDNPMRTLIGSGEGEGALFEPEPQSRQPAQPDAPDAEPPALNELMEAGRATQPERPAPGSAGMERNRHRNLPSLAPDPNPDGVRSRFDPEAGIVYYNEAHSDYLLVKDEEPALLDYLATLVAKEYVVYNNPRATSEDVAEEMVRMLVRVRRHLPAKRWPQAPGGPNRVR